MFFPIFIPYFFYNQNDEDKHGYGCECPKCKSTNELYVGDRRYYLYRYAIPNSWKRKKLISRILRFSPILFCILFNILWAFIVGILWMWLIIPISLSVCFFVYMVLGLRVKNDIHCPNLIYIYKNDSETWDDAVKRNNVPDDYYLTEVEETWEYK